MARLTRTSKSNTVDNLIKILNINDLKTYRMMKKNILPIALASTLLVAACSPDSITSAGKDDSEKTPIEFSMTDNTSAAVAVNGNTRAGFTAETGIVMQMVATNSTSTSDTKTTKTIATASKAESGKSTSSVSFGEGSNANVRYWDDAYGRNTKLSVYAVAVPGKTLADNSPLKQLGGTEEASNTWTTSSSNSLTWTLTNQNTSSTHIDSEDLVYSNNIKENGSPNGVYRWNFTSNAYSTYDETKDNNGLEAGQMLFTLKSKDATDGPGKFDRGNLNFVHALSRVTIKVKYGSEFGESEAFAEPTLINMPYKGTFDVKTGTFSATTEGQSDASKDKSNVAMATASDTNDESIKKLCVGQVLPGYEISSSSDANFLSFKIGSNVYYVTQASVFKALNITENSSKLTKKTDDDNTIVMTQGQNYVLTITVSKTGVNNLTATLADWTTIEGSAERNNAYLNFTFSDYATNSSSKNFTLYRSKYTYEKPVTGTGYTANYDWDKGYSNNAATLTEPTGDSKVWKTAWYWDSNKDFYHFRMVGKGSGTDAKALEIKTEGTEESSKKEYFEIKSGESDGNYRWGAPMAKSGDTDQTLTYSTTNGFDAVSNGESDSHHISAAIGATNDNIHLTEVNTLAKIVVNLATSEGDDKVTFNGTDNKTTTVELMNIYTDGKVYMGNGLVVTSGSRSATDAKMTEPTEDSKGYTYYVVPQALKEGDSGSETYVTFKITTPDNNVYYVKEKLSEIKASKVTNGTNVSIGQTQDTAIDYWYPNCTYTYTFTVKKTGIDKFTATLVPYTEIEGTNTDISLED